MQHRSLPLDTPIHPVYRYRNWFRRRLKLNGGRACQKAGQGEAQVFDKIWEDYISLNSQDEPTFELLPPAADMQDRTSYSVDLASLILPRDLNYYLCADQSAIPVPEDREGYFGPRHFEYWLSGLVTAQETLALTAKFGTARQRYVELGSASGRVIRHLAYDQDAFSENWAFDINWRHVCWINRHLPKNIVAIQNSSIPSLPLEDSSVDVLSAMSVFSHVEVFELQWLAEIRRILKRGGIAIISLQTDTQIEKMTPDWPVYNALTNHSRWNEHFFKDLEEQGKIVLRWVADKSYSSNVIYHNAYIENVWGRMFDVVRQPEKANDFQTIYVIRKR